MKKLLLLLILNFSFLIFNCFAQQYGWVALPWINNTDVIKRIYLSGNEAWLLVDNIIYHSSNYPSIQFVQQFTGTNFNDFTFSNQSGNIYSWAVGYSSLGARTTDTAGHTWTQMSLGGTSTYNSVSFPTTSLGYASGTDKRLHKTVNGGANWTDAGVVLGFSAVSTLFFVDSNTGYVGTADPRLAKTTDGGATWIDEGDITGSINDIYFYDSTHGWAVGITDILYYNNGIWTQLNNTTGNALNSVFFINANEGWIAGNSGTILHSTDGGVNWTAQTSGTSAILMDVFFTSSENGYAVGNSGTILHYTQLTDVKEQPTQPTEFKLEQNYPNPFNPSTSIQYAIISRQFVQLKVYDVLGNEIATLVNEEKAPGRYEVEFLGHSDGGQNLSSGVYFYQLSIIGPETSSGQGLIQTKKMIIMK
jgi:photosystem II stability/assembly factor-like uncharacterized protein